jgi:hypothetical protein
MQTTDEHAIRVKARRVQFSAWQDSEDKEVISFSGSGQGWFVPIAFVQRRCVMATSYLKPDD